MTKWDWELTDTARRDFDGLDEYARDRIASKLDEIVADEWRDPPERGGVPAYACSDDLSSEPTATLSPRE